MEVGKEINEYDSGQFNRDRLSGADRLVVLGGTSMKLFIYQPSWLGRLGLALSIALATVVGIFLWAIFLALFLALAVVAGGWLWWQSRRLRQRSAEYIEAEYVVVREPGYELLVKRRLEESSRSKPQNLRLRGPEQ